MLPAGAPATATAIMLRDVPTVHHNTPLAETLDRLLETQKRRVVVTDDPAARDWHYYRWRCDPARGAARATRRATLARGMARRRGTASQGFEVAARGRTAADIMTSPVVTVGLDAPIGQIIQLMIAHRVKRLPVLDADGRLAGLIGRAGVLAALSHQQNS